MSSAGCVSSRPGRRQRRARREDLLLLRQRAACSASRRTRRSTSIPRIARHACDAGARGRAADARQAAPAATHRRTLRTLNLAPSHPRTLAPEYTCPMHPEVVSAGPGSCPICGMALEPVEVSLEEQPNEELDDMSRRFWWSLALTAPILAFMVVRVPARSAAASSACRRGDERGSSSRSRRRSCCGAAGRSSSAAGRRSSAGT